LSLRTDVPQRELPLHDLLVSCLRSRDSQLWDVLVGRLQPIFARVVYRVATNRSAAHSGDVDDVIQECFLKLDAICRRAYAMPSAFDCEQTALAYLKALAANAARDYIRQKNADKRGSGQTTSVEHRLYEIAGPDAPNIERGILIRQIDRLLGPDTRERTIFWLYYKQGLTAREIAALPVFQLTQKGVESLLRRLTIAIREQLKFPEGFSGPEAYS
jgi:RNA polymerase sigma-70 factor, ECF subfamily